MSDQLFVIVALVGFALTGMATWLVAVTIVRNRIAAGAITLATIGNPVFWGWWTAALPESLFTAVFLAGIWLLLLNSPKARFGAGVLLAASIYVKGFAVLYLPLAGAFVVFGTTRPRARHVMGFAAGAVLTFALAEIALPTGTSQLSGASSQYAGSMLLYETRGAYPAHEGPLYDTTPLEPFGYVLTHPIDYGEKVARMMIRTKQTVEVLGGPAVGGVLFPLLLLIGFSVGHDLFGWLRQVRGPTLGGQDPHVTSTRLLLAGLLLVNFVFFWGGNFKDRYFAHLFPLMLAAAYLEFNRLVPDAANWWRKIPRLIVVLAAGYFLAYPPAVGLWKAYRDPYAYLGRMLAVRWVDYAEVAGTVVAHVPADGMVMSDMAHEITWYTDRPTVFFPGSEDQLDYLLDKFDVDAMYEHPRTAREWSSIDERFELVDEVNPRRFATLSLFGGAGVFFSIPSVFASFPTVNLVALKSLRSWSSDRRRTKRILLIALGYDLLILAAYFLLQSRTNELVQNAFRRGFIRVGSPMQAWRTVTRQGRNLIETGLPSWTETTAWNPDTVSWTLPIVGLGLVWLLARKSTRLVGLVIAGFYGAFLTASILRIYPLGIGRTDIFAFPVGICLFVAGIHGLTSWVPRATLVRLVAGVGVAAVAIYQPVQVKYWDVDDVRLIRRLEAVMNPSDGLILSPAGAYLASYYGDWQVVISGTSARTNATQADIVRDSTLHLHPGVDARARITQFLEDDRPPRIWYVAYRTRRRGVLETLGDHGYLFNAVERTRRGRLYLLLDRRN